VGGANGTAAALGRAAGARRWTGLVAAAAGMAGAGLLAEGPRPAHAQYVTGGATNPPGDLVDTNLQVNGRITLTGATGFLIFKGGNNPAIYLQSAAQPLDSKNWQLVVRNTQTLTGELLNDASGGQVNWLAVTRSQMVVSSVAFPNGNVLIGTAAGTPGVKLEVADGGATLMRVQADGNVGIGTAAAAYSLHVQRAGAQLTAVGWYRSLRLVNQGAMVFGGGSPYYFVGSNGEGLYQGKLTSDGGTEAPDYTGRIDLATGEWRWYKDVVVQRVTATEPQLRVHNPTNGQGQMSGIRLKTDGWDVQLRTRQGVAWLELTDSAGSPYHQWNGFQYVVGGRLIADNGGSYYAP
jgi:hypothetical protein